MAQGELAPGTKLGHITIVRLIGEGATGMVYEGEHVALRKRVAVKTLKPELATNVDIKERFLREGIAASRIRHPHAVDIFDVGHQGDLAYLVMEYLEGESLADLLARDRNLSVGRTLNVMIPVMAAVNAAHAEGIVHRDLKPENIFLAITRDGVVVPKVLDFGISKLTSQSRPARLTGGDGLFGTPAYMSPEQITSPRGVDARADQWALGVILFECVTGVLPFEAESMYALMKKIVEGRSRPLRSASALLPAKFVDAVERALGHCPDDRFGSVADLARELLPLAPRRTRAAWTPVFAPGTEQNPSDLPPAPPPATLEAIQPDFVSPTSKITSLVPLARSSLAAPELRRARLKSTSAMLIALALTAGGVAALAAHALHAPVATTSR